jgi:holin-like protein
MREIVLGFTLIVGIFLSGDFLHRIGVPIPGGVLGLLLFFVGLQTKLVKLKWVDRAAALLLRHMVLLFIPLTVGLMNVGNLVSRQIWAICISVVFSFVAVLLATGLLGDRLLAPTNGEGEFRKVS